MAVVWARDAQGLVLFKGYPVRVVHQSTLYPNMVILANAFVADFDPINGIVRVTHWDGRLLLPDHFAYSRELIRCDDTFGFPDRRCRCGHSALRHEFGGGCRLCRCERSLVEVARVGVGPKTVRGSKQTVTTYTKPYRKHPHRA